ncbi:MAG: glutamate mutase L [Actinobacteria bacterium]|nr:glutamate mutase L [Actinomycetota bacterium]
MKVDILVAEIGSTTTKVNAFNFDSNNNLLYIGRGEDITTVEDGDVTIGLEKAINQLKKNLNTKKLLWSNFYASSSAAGGLRMSVHGLVKEMTAKAANEAALGAGAVVRMVTVGILSEFDLDSLVKLNPNIIILSGGVDYGEKKTVITNAKLISKTALTSPIVYAGNIAAANEVKQILKNANKKVYVVDNVYPNIDELNIKPAREIIQNVFEEHIVKAPGMEKIRDMVDQTILPTPGAVMKISSLLADKIGDLIIVDIGGATTDVHSITNGSPSIQRITISPEPHSKRTVEGDLGVFYNVENVIKIVNKNIFKKIGIDDIDIFKSKVKQIPQTKKEEKYYEILGKVAAKKAVERHAGKIRQLFGPTGRKNVAKGRDLTATKYIIGTGGVLVRNSGAERILESIKSDVTVNEIITKSKILPSQILLPSKDAKTLIDNLYLFSSLGCFCDRYPEQSIRLAKQSIGLKI